MQLFFQFPLESFYQDLQKGQLTDCQFPELNREQFHLKFAFFDVEHLKFDRKALSSVRL